MNPIGGRSVTDIAVGFGFNSLWTFNRNFRQAFGVAPGEMRARAHQF
jgi:AraC-like DNA-binding protein